VWSVTSFTSCAATGSTRNAGICLHPETSRRASYVAGTCAGRPPGPAVAATDYIKTHADQIRPFIDRRYVALGTDGYGRSDYRRKLREFFEVDRRFVALAALKALADEGTHPRAKVSERCAPTESIRPSRIR
jgi:pyruvate dehydrogenase E1 component